MSWMGGATAPLSSSSSESALGLLSDLATAWFSMGPLPSPPASGCRPVISSTAASTAGESGNTSVRKRGRSHLSSLRRIVHKHVGRRSRYLSLDPRPQQLGALGTRHRGPGVNLELWRGTREAASNTDPVTHPVGRRAVRTHAGDLVPKRSFADEVADYVRAR
ncbi:hypothetical protein EYF80_013978 [Liparis tanakae]|uniref:Uncharacterized protein n=1 Tax=Liparis tanakae TaxID=230148 RepID=A0A4Z2IDL4_9TELE|nr:hypothetical protein EYF80_013978 [Liparis tanakae]